MLFLAQLNEENICIAIKTAEKLIEGHVEVESLDFDYYIFRKYEDGKWSQEKYLPNNQHNAAPTIEDKINFIYYKQMGVI